jgi:protein involved in ribonucleotide reduction
MEDIKKTFEKVVESGKEFAEDIKLKENLEKAKDVTLDAVDKVAQKFEELKQDEELKAKIKERADDVVETVKEGAKTVSDKTVEFFEKPEVKEKIDGVVESGKKMMDDINKNENVQKVVDSVKEGAKTVSDKTVEFFEKPEVQEKIEDVKEKTLDIAEKGISKLREWFKPKQKDEEE